MGSVWAADGGRGWRGSAPGCDLPVTMMEAPAIRRLTGPSRSQDRYGQTSRLVSIGARNAERRAQLYIALRARQPGTGRCGPDGTDVGGGTGIEYEEESQDEEAEETDKRR